MWTPPESTSDVDPWAPPTRQSQTLSEASDSTYFDAPVAVWRPPPTRGSFARSPSVSVEAEWAPSRSVWTPPRERGGPSVSVDAQWEPPRDDGDLGAGLPDIEIELDARTEAMAKRLARAPSGSLNAQFLAEQERRRRPTGSVRDLAANAPSFLLIPLRDSDPTADMGEGVDAGAGGVEVGTATVVRVAQARPSGSHRAIPFHFEDVPRDALTGDQESFFAGLTMTYSLLLWQEKTAQIEALGLRAFNPDTDTVGVINEQLLTLLYATRGDRPSRRPLLWVFPSHDRLMSIPLRLVLYGDITPDRKLVDLLSPFTWRHTRALRVEEADDGPDTGGGGRKPPSDAEMEIRRSYMRLLVRLFRDLWIRERLAAVAPALRNDKYRSVLDRDLDRWRPEDMTPAVLEARVRALAARLQLRHRSFINTARYLDAAKAVLSVIEPNIGRLIGTYTHFVAPAAVSMPTRPLSHPLEDH